MSKFNFSDKDSQTTSRIRRLRERDDKAFVLVLMALIISGLLLMAGFAVDLGYWYLRSAQMQRAADYAALSGAKDMPNIPAAQAAALATASKNGFKNGDPGVTVNVAPDASNSKLSVTINDTQIPAFFTA